LVTNLKCVLRIFVGLLLGLAPAATLFVYGAVRDLLDADGLRAVIFLGAPLGAALGAIGGTLWAMVYLNAQTKAAEGARVE
jgi:hypothetical protein